jgi:hypothetical protein
MSPQRAIVLTMGFCAALAVSGCTGGQQSPDRGGDLVGGPDETPVPKITFAPAGPTTAGVWLELESADLAAQRFSLKILGSGLANVYGISGRLVFDRGLCTLESATAGAALGAGAAAVAAGASSVEGGLFGVSRTGDFSAGVALDGTQVIGTLSFVLADRGTVGITFAPERSRILDPRFQKVEVGAWLGGAVTLE